MSTWMILRRGIYQLYHRRIEPADRYGPSRALTAVAWPKLVEQARRVIVRSATDRNDDIWAACAPLDIVSSAATAFMASDHRMPYPSILNSDADVCLYRHLKSPFQNN